MTEIMPLAMRVNELFAAYLLVPGGAFYAVLLVVFRLRRVPSVELRRFHWRLRLIGLVLLVASGGVLVLRGNDWRPVLGLAVAILIAQAFHDWPDAWAWGLLLRWKAAAISVGLGGQVDGKEIAPRLSRVWIGAEVVRIQFRPWKGQATSGFDDKVGPLAQLLGMAGGRLVERSNHLGGPCIVLELRRSVVFPTVEVAEIRRPAEAEVAAARVLPRLPAPVLVSALSVEGPPGVAVPGDASVRWHRPDMHLPPDCRRLWRLKDGEWQPHDHDLERREQCSMGDRVYEPSGSDFMFPRPTGEQVAAWAQGRTRVPGYAGVDRHRRCIDAYERGQLGQQTARPVAADDWASWLERVAVGVKAGGRWELCLIENHVLVVGMTGAGKGSVFWSIVHGLAPAVLEGVVRLWAIDPKRLELGMGRGAFYRYANRAEAMVALLEEAEAAAQERMDRLSGRARKFTPSQDTPVEVVLIDELGFLVSMADRKLRDRFDTALNNLLFMGRAVGFVLVGAIVDPRKSWLDSRENWPTRVALRLSSKSLVDMALRDDAYDQGARCDAIPRGQTGAGTGYVISEDLAAPEMVRAFWVDDDAVEDLERELAGVVAASSPAPAPAGLHLVDGEVTAPAQAKGGAA